MRKRIQKREVKPKTKIIRSPTIKQNTRIQKPKGVVDKIGHKLALKHIKNQKFNTTDKGFFDKALYVGALLSGLGLLGAILIGGLLL